MGLGKDNGEKYFVLCKYTAAMVHSTDSHPPRMMTKIVIITERVK